MKIVELSNIHYTERQVHAENCADIARTMNSGKYELDTYNSIQDYADIYEDLADEQGATALDIVDVEADVKPCAQVFLDEARN